MAPTRSAQTTKSCMVSNWLKYLGDRLYSLYLDDLTSDAPKRIVIKGMIVVLRRKHLRETREAVDIHKLASRKPDFGYDIALFLFIYL